MKQLPTTISHCKECPYGSFTAMAHDYIHGYCKRYDISMYNDKYCYGEGTHPSCRLGDTQ